MRLLSGRRVQINDLLDHGVLEAGVELEFVRKRLGVTHRALVTSDGCLRLDDGRKRSTPSRAATDVAETGQVDGWNAWAIAGGGPTLASLRRQLINQVAHTAPDSTPSGSDGPESRHDRLERARTSAEAGEPEQLTVRQLLGFWGAQLRGHRVVNQILVDLENHGLETDPDFRKVGLSTTIRLVLSPEGEPEEDEEPPFAASDTADVGLTLGNVPSALGGVVSVNPNDSLLHAMTVLRLNDFSQLAVLPTPRHPKGEVSWRSIAKALAKNPDAGLDAATEQTVVLPYDKDLIDVLPTLYERDFVFVANGTNEVSGIVTAADVVKLYGEMAAPFFMLGEVDHLLRNLIADHWTVEQVSAICHPDGEKVFETQNDLTMGEYQFVLDNGDRFEMLGWPVERVPFIEALDRVRIIRNAVAHFDPDPPSEEDVEAVRNFLHLLRELGES